MAGATNNSLMGMKMIAAAKSSSSSTGGGGGVKAPLLLLALLASLTLLSSSSQAHGFRLKEEQDSSPPLAANNNNNNAYQLRNPNPNTNKEEPKVKSFNNYHHQSPLLLKQPTSHNEIIKMKDSSQPSSLSSSLQEAPLYGKVSKSPHIVQSVFRNGGGGGGAHYQHEHELEEEAELDDNLELAQLLNSPHSNRIPPWGFLPFHRKQQPFLSAATHHLQQQRQRLNADDPEELAFLTHTPHGGGTSATAGASNRMMMSGIQIPAFGGSSRLEEAEQHGGGGSGGDGMLMWESSSKSKKRSSSPAALGISTEYSSPYSSAGGAGDSRSRTTDDIKRSRPYDIPQIECPLADDGMERFACPTPDSVGRYRCVDDHVLCDGFIDCPNAEDEDRHACMFYKTTKAHLDVLADALLRWARGK